VDHWCHAGAGARGDSCIEVVYRPGSLWFGTITLTTYRPDLVVSSSELLLFPIRILASLYSGSCSLACGLPHAGPPLAESKSRSLWFLGPQLRCWDKFYHRVIDVDHTPLPSTSSDLLIREGYLKAALRPQAAFFTEYRLYFGNCAKRVIGAM